VAVQPDLITRPAGLWDGEEWMRRDAAFTGYAKLAPTAALAGLWQFNPAASLYLRAISFTTDTAIEWTLFWAGIIASVPAVTVRNAHGGGGGASNTFFAGPLAPLAIASPVTSGFAPANSTTWLTPQGFPFFTSATLLNLQTATVAANCAATFYCIQATL
jgi:hypothetical protein